MNVLEHEPEIRLLAFSGTLLLMLAIQYWWPARGDGRWSRRQGVNAALVLIDTLLVRLAFPVLAVGFAVLVYERQGGLFGWLDWPLWLSIPVAVLILDLAIYWQHRLMHMIPLLWRLHRVHHADTGFDVTTGVRFHPLEIALSNYGFHLSVWDRLFASYTAEPRENELTMPIGLNEFREPADQGLISLLLNPFRNPERAERTKVKTKLSRRDAETQRKIRT